MGSLRAYPRERFKTGDVIAFGGKGRVSRIIKAITHSEISHVGLVLRWPERDTVFLAESTTLSDLADVIHGERLSGAQLVFLSRRLELYEGSAWWYPIDVDALDTSAAEHRLMVWLREKRPYDTLQAIGAGVDLLDGLGLENDPDYAELFCSELVARFHQLCGLIAPTANPSEMTPADVCAMEYLGERERLK